MSAPSVLVLTVVHHPGDARIAHRQLPALVAAGWHVTYAAPWTGYGLAVPPDDAQTRHLDLPRASGRRRLAALRSARALLRAQAGRHDLVLVHDPELLAAASGLGLRTLVWDVHEDPAAALRTREWVPAPLRRPLSAVVAAAERRVERRHPLLLAEAAYADRFARPHPVVPNSAPVPDAAGLAPAGTPGADGVQRVVYVGSVTRERGVEQLVELAARLAADSPRVARIEVAGPAHGDAGDLLRDAARHDLRWLGRLDRDAVPEFLAGALAGLSLLHDLPNYRPSLPTKVIEYLAHGIPVITTPLPLAAGLVEAGGGGVVVPFTDAAAAHRVVRSWAADPRHAAGLGRAGHAHVQTAHNWDRDAAAFVAAMTRLGSTRAS